VASGKRAEHHDMAIRCADAILVMAIGGSNEKVWTGFTRQRRTRSILPLRWASSFADNGINAKLAVWGRGQAPVPSTVPG